MPLALALTGLVGAAAWAMNAAHDRPGGALFVYGWVDAGAAAPVYSTSVLAAGLLAATRRATQPPELVTVR